MRFTTYWLFPVLSGLTWLTTLLGLLLYWVVGTSQQRYGSMLEGQTLVYISDVGAAEMKPLFVTGCALTGAFLDISFGADRWLRHRGRLAPNLSRGEKALHGLGIAFALLGTVGLVGLAILDVAAFPQAHYACLMLFMAGFLLSAFCVCAEYQRLGHKWREQPMLRRSFWTKLVFIVIELGLVVAFGTCHIQGWYDTAAVLEWTVSFAFSFYVFSFVIDLWPARHTRARDRQRWKEEMLKAAYGHAHV